MATGWKSSYFRYKDYFLNVSALYKKRADLRAFLEIVLSIVAVIVFVMFALKPTALTIISLLNQIKEEKKTLSALNQKINNLQTAQTVLIKNQNFLNNINTAVSSNPSPDVSMKQIEALSAKNSVNLVGMSMNDIVLVGSSKNTHVTGEAEPLPEGANEMGYSISIQGSFANIYSFIKDLENLRVVSSIDSITINSSIKDTGRVIVALISGRFPYVDANK